MYKRYFIVYLCHTRYVLQSSLHAATIQDVTNTQCIFINIFINECWFHYLRKFELFTNTRTETLRSRLINRSITFTSIIGSKIQKQH